MLQFGFVCGTGYPHLLHQLYIKPHPSPDGLLSDQATGSCSPDILCLLSASFQHAEAPWCLASSHSVLQLEEPCSIQARRLTYDHTGYMHTLAQDIGGRSVSVLLCFYLAPDCQKIIQLSCGCELKPEPAPCMDGVDHGKYCLLLAVDCPLWKDENQVSG